MNGVALAVEHVEKSFPVTGGTSTILNVLGRKPRRVVLHDISLEVRRGELFGLLGPNGAGKSTLLRLLATLSLPDRGRLLIEGIDVAKQPMAAKRRIGLCTADERSFYFRLTARHNLQFFGALAGLEGATLRRRIDEVAELVDLREALDRRFGTYSSGMKQRLTMARALLADPGILFLDEPTRAVDPVHAEDLRRLIRERLVEASGKTVVLATNLLDEAWSICDRVAVVNHGRIVACGPPRELDAAMERVARYRITLDRVDEGVLARTRGISGLRDLRVVETQHGFQVDVEVEPGDAVLGDLLRAVSYDGAVLRDFRPVEAEPVDVFRRVTAGGPDERR